METSAQRLQRLVASAADLVAHARHHDMTSERLVQSAVPPGARGMSPPVCTEPYCGGFDWTWKPPRSPRPVRTPAAPDAEILQPLLEAAAGEKPEVDVGGEEKHAEHTHEDLADKYPEAPQAVRDALTAYQHLKMTSKRKDAYGDFIVERERPPVLVDFTSARFYPPLKAPVAKEVQLFPPQLDKYPYWLAAEPRRLAVKDKREMKTILERLNTFLRVKNRFKMHDISVGSGERLLAVKPKDSPLQTAPFLGSVADLWKLPKKKYPVQMTFGQYGINHNTGASGNPVTPLVPPIEAVVRHYPTVSVKRLDIVLQRPTPDYSAAPTSGLPAEAMKAGHSAMTSALEVPLRGSFRNFF